MMILTIRLERVAKIAPLSRAVVLDEMEGDMRSIEIPVQTIDEPRYLVIGTIAGKHWSGIITYRGNEVEIYESKSA